VRVYATHSCQVQQRPSLGASFQWVESTFFIGWGIDPDERAEDHRSNEVVPEHNQPGAGNLASSVNLSDYIPLLTSGQVLSRYLQRQR
jgi:hypothetical protein